MGFLADENVPQSVIGALRDRGHDVLAVREVLRGADDRTLLRRAQHDARVVLTFDKDFGELAFRARLPATYGVILFRPSGASLDEDLARALAAFESRQEWVGFFAVVTDTLIRLRSLPET